VSFDTENLIPLKADKILGMLINAKWSGTAWKAMSEMVMGML